MRHRLLLNLAIRHQFHTANLNTHLVLVQVEAIAMARVVLVAATVVQHTTIVSQKLPVLL